MRIVRRILFFLAIVAILTANDRPADSCPFCSAPSLTLSGQVAQSDAELVLSVLEDSGAAVVGLDSAGRITIWSRGAESLFGHQRKDAIGYGIAFLIPNGMREAHRASFESAMNGGTEPFHQVVTCEALHANGELLPVEIDVWGIPGHRALAVFSRNEG